VLIFGAGLFSIDTLVAKRMTGLVDHRVDQTASLEKVVG
jgi:hypothetical protein